MDSLWAPILQTALRTPSPHNTQPWRLRIRDERHATLFMEKARTLPDEDTTGHFLQCAMGMFLEALRLIAANAGFLLRHTLIDEENPGPFLRFAELELNGSAEPSPYPDSLFQTRRTSRLGSSGARIDLEAAQMLSRIGAKDGQHYTQLDDPELIEAIVEENIRAVFHDLNVRAYHREISRWFRYTRREAEAKADGLDYRCMRIPPIQLMLMKRLPQIMSWPVTRGLVRRTYRRQLGKVSHIGMISGPFFGDAEAVSAGAFLMRFWLELARLNLFIHPFGNLVTNAQAKACIHELTGIENVWLVFRIGRTDEPPESLRRPLREVLVHD